MIKPEGVLHIGLNNLKKLWKLEQVWKKYAEIAKPFVEKG